MEINLKKNKFFIISIILLLINFFFRLINQSKMLKYFPVDYNTDGASYMAQLFFLKSCGFHNICNYWYNGFVNFLHSPPGWYVFTLPIFNITKIVNVATYISMIIIFLLSFIIIYYCYGKINFTKFERIALFIFFFGNAIAVGNFIKLIRVHELFAWMNFLIFFFIIYYYKDKPIDKRIYLISLVYTFILISYQSVGVIVSILFLSLFLVKKGKEKIYVLLAALFSLILSAFWWLPAILRFNDGGIAALQQGIWLLRFDKLNFYTNIFATIIPIIFLITFYLYYNKNKDKNELLFYLPVIVLIFIFLFRVYPFIPFFGNIFPDPYLVFFIFFISFLFFKIKFSIKLLKLLPYIIFIIVLISLTFSVFRTPLFIVPNSSLNIDIENSLSKVNKSFLFFGELGSYIQIKNIYSYAPTKYNISTPFGWYPEVKNVEYLDSYYKNVNDNFVKKDCKNFKKYVLLFNVTDIITIDNDCDFLLSCDFKFKHSFNKICIYSV